MRTLFSLLSLLVACGGGHHHAAPPTSAPASHPASQPGAHSGGHHHGEAPHGEANQHGHHHRFVDAEAWARRFDDPARDAWQKPEAVVARLKLAPDARVGDVGAGTGYFAVRIARAVPQGQVYGADLEETMVAYLDARAAKEGLSNLKGVKVGPKAPGLPEPVDLIFICNTWHHIGQRVEWLKAALADLKPGARVAIVDYKRDAEGPGPPKEMRLSPEAVIAEFAAAGFSLAERDDDLLPRQYLLIFTRP